MALSLSQLVKQHVERWLKPLIDTRAGLMAVLQTETAKERLRRSRETHGWKQKKSTLKTGGVHSSVEITNRKTSP